MASHCAGNTTMATAERTGCVILKRESATIRNSAKALHTISLERADGPCLKKGGGVRSRVPNGIGGLCPAGQAAGASTSLAGEDRTQPFHALQRDAAASHHAGQRVFGHQ